MAERDGEIEDDSDRAARLAARTQLGKWVVGSERGGEGRGGAEAAKRW